MSTEEAFRGVIYNNAQYTFTLIIHEDDQAIIELKTSRRGPEMTNIEDVVVIMDGRGVPLRFDTPRRVVAEVGPWAPFADRTFTLAIRVGEFYDSWEFGGEGE